jgi:hypothetical protein
MIENFYFENFEESKHMLEWLHPDPFEALKSEFQSNLEQQVPGSILLGLHVTGNPQWLTGGIRQDDDDSKIILVRAAVAFSFELSVKTPENIIYDLSGIYSWAAVNMNSPENIAQRTWMDLNGTIEQFGSEGELAHRVYFETDF